MKTPIKTLACAAVASIAFLACDDIGTNNDTEQNAPTSSSSNVQSSSSSEVTGMPVRDSRVVSYKKYALDYGDVSGGVGFITDKDTLKSVFPHIFDNEQSKCNYFAIYFTYASSVPYYWILSQDMILYKIMPGSGILGGTTDIFYSAMLVCDDTAEGKLKNRIDINSTRSYIDPDWDYDRERVEDRNVFF